ncbi:hypothetical protein ACJJTC_013068, partial [Scirpophaga incertulas]
RPLWVRLQGGKRPLVAGQSTELVCQAVGARPKPTISWWKGGTRLKTVRETTSTDGNITSSILTFVPSIDDAGRVLSCRAVQPSLPHSTHEDGWKMEIQHLPVVKLELGANLDANKVLEGSDVYLDCRVRANPWHTHVYFTHNVRLHACQAFARGKQPQASTNLVWRLKGGYTLGNASVCKIDPSMSDTELVTAIAFGLSYFYLKCKQSETKKRKTRRQRRWWMKKIHRNRTRQFIEEKFNELLYEPSGEFDNFCRMSFTDFEFLLQKISPMISKQDTDVRDAIPTKFRFAIMLRFLASGDSYNSLHYLFKVSVSMISLTIREVCRALNEILKDLVKMPTTAEGWLNIEEGFRTKFPHCIGLFDGKHVVIESPTHRYCGKAWQRSTSGQSKSGPATRFAEGSGAYVCSARNGLGEGSSDKLILDVKYSPTCKTTQPAVLRAARGELIDIECDLDANPKGSMIYHWWFNSSAHTKHELTTSTSTSQSPPGVFTYMVNTSSDYGWVQCSGANSVGRQTKPCLFHILPADKPSAVKACEITNVTYDSLTLNCTAGHDGGIRQAFLLQVFDMVTGLLLRNVSNDVPEFEVSGLLSSVSLAVSVRAFNKKGASEPLTLTSSLLKYPQRHTAQVPVKVELTTVLIIVLSTVGVVAALTAISGAVFCCRYCSKKDNKNEKDKRQQDETSNIPLTGSKETESVDSLDKNPDIIPLDGKISDSCSNKSSTTDYSSIRPLISKTASDKYDMSHCDRFYDHTIDPCNQYIQVRPIDYRVRQTYQPNLVPMPNLGPSIQSLGPMTSLGHVPNIGSNECHRQYDKVYEDWLKYKNALPLNTSGLLPAEQLMPPELYASPPTLYSNPRNPLNLTQMPDLEARYHLDSRSCSSSPPVRFNPEGGSVYFSKAALDRSTNTLPHLKTRLNSNMSNQSEVKASATKSTETNLEHVTVTTQECG